MASNAKKSTIPEAYYLAWFRLFPYLQRKVFLHKIFDKEYVDTIQQISIDNSRYLLYALTHKGHIQVCL